MSDPINDPFEPEWALEPAYIMSRPNEPVLLFEGNLRLLTSEVIYEGDGQILLECLPSPGIRFILNSDASHIEYDKLPIGSAKLIAMDEPSISLDVFITEVNMDRDNTWLSGDLSYALTIHEKSDECTDVKFHMINSTRYSGSCVIRSSKSIFTGRLLLENDDWQILIDEDDNAKELYKHLEKHGGYAITHTGLLRRLNGSLDFDEINNQLEALYYFLAFLSGRWCGPVLAVGQSSGSKIWKTWDVITEEWYAILDELDETGNHAKNPISGARDGLRLTPWLSGWKWTIGIDSYELNQAFLGFMKKWNDDSWRDPLKSIISLYIEANLALGGTEGAIILAQSALELFASLYEREKKVPWTSEADVRIRRLLKYLGIPIAIPLYAKDLKHFCEFKLSTQKFKDGPRALTLVRNGITHPHGRKDAEDKIKLQVLSLGLWYVELVLLHYLEYTGRYANRLWRFRDNAFKGGSDFLESVPWSNASNGS